MQTQVLYILFPAKQDQHTCHQEPRNTEDKSQGESRIKQAWGLLVEGREGRSQGRNFRAPQTHINMHACVHTCTHVSAQGLFLNQTTVPGLVVSADGQLRALDTLGPGQETPECHPSPQLLSWLTSMVASFSSWGQDGCSISTLMSTQSGTGTSN